LLGLGEHERITGFIHVGTPKLETPERERPDPAALLSDWIAPRRTGTPVDEGRGKP
jgi:nitroreductase